MMDKDIFKEIKDVREELENLYREKNDSTEKENELAKKITEREEKIKKYCKHIENLDMNLQISTANIDRANTLIERARTAITIEKRAYIPTGILGSFCVIVGAVNIGVGCNIITVLFGAMTVGCILDIIKDVIPAKKNIGFHQAKISEHIETIRVNKQKKKDYSLQLEKAKETDPRKKLNDEISDIKPQLNSQKDFTYNIDKNIKFYEVLLTRLEQKLMEMMENSDIDYSILDEKDITVVNELIGAGLNQDYTFSKKPKGNHL